MSQTLTDLFEARGSNSVTWQGREVMALVEIPIGPGDRIRVRRLGSSLVRAQAIKLAVDRGAITVGGYSGPVVALWSHTAPADLLLEVDGPATAIQLWNAWSLDGVDNSWLGNAAIMVDDHGGGLTLQCSDGVGEPDFSDLVVWVSVTSSRPVTPAASETKSTPAAPEPAPTPAPQGTMSTQGAQETKSTQGAQTKSTPGAQETKSTQGAQTKSTQGAPTESTQGAQTKSTQAAQTESTQEPQTKSTPGPETSSTAPLKRQGAPRTSPIAKSSSPPSAKPPPAPPRPDSTSSASSQAASNQEPERREDAQKSSAPPPSGSPDPNNPDDAADRNSSTER